MQELFKKFSNVKVLVLGDLMLDQYWWGSVDRISPEAPVPIVNLSRKSFVAGGAANVAANISRLGATPILFGAIGNDLEGEKLLDVLGNIDVSGDNIISFDTRQTTTKTRVVGENQQIVRIDQEDISTLSESEEDLVWNDILDVAESADIFLVSDYAKGFVTENLTMRLITFASENNKIVLVDPKGKNYSKYKNASLITPNQKEALAVTDLESEDDKTTEFIGNKLLNDLCLEALIITRGKKGMSLFQKDKTVKNLSASARKVFDVTGAGDTVIATLAVTIGSGADFYDAANIANLAAGIVVEEVGTTTINLEKLKKHFGV